MPHPGRLPVARGFWHGWTDIRTQVRCILGGHVVSSDLPAVQMVLIAVVPVISLVVWLTLVYLAARKPHRQDDRAMPATPGIEHAAAGKKPEKQAA